MSWKPVSRDREAWLAFEEGRLTESQRLWRGLIAAADSERQRDEYRAHYAYVLVAMSRFGEARALYERLFDRYGSHRYLHQLAMVEREAGEFSAALDLLDREDAMLPADAPLAKAANLYERALVHFRLGRSRAAHELLDKCLAAAIASEDPTMLGAAHRLQGDMFAMRDPARAGNAYRLAIDYFRAAQDRFGEAEIEERIQRLKEPPDSDVEPRDEPA
jgi:tetratricopeptide (TPR) repeat protein